ncbi:MAG: alpha/beta fold hydrolase [Actinomycetales bacterium]
MLVRIRAGSIWVTAVVLAMVAAVPGIALGSTGTPGEAATGSGDRGHGRHHGWHRGDVDDHSGDARYGRYYGQSLQWSEATCPETSEPYLPGVWECARVVAPLDWQDPAKGDIELSISREASTAGAARLLLTNPGGPGGSGLEFGVGVGLGTGLDATHSVIGIDPRGVGESSPVMCPLPMPDPAGYTSDGDSRTFDRASVLATAQETRRRNELCVESAGSVLPSISTVQTARDFNLIRAVLGYQTTDFYGVSYGTWLGSTLEKLFPSRVDRVVLDANTAWMSGSFTTLFDLWPSGFQASFDRTLLPFIARHDDRYHLGTTSEQVNESYEQIRAWFASDPGRGITPSLLDEAMMVALYDAEMYPLAADLLSQLNVARLQAVPVEDETVVGLGSQLRALAGETIVGEFNATQLAVICNDTPSDQDPARWYRTRVRQARTLPLAGPGSLVNPCLGWPYQPTLTRAVVNRPVQNVLMLDNEVDPATPYPGALQARFRARGSVRMVSVDNGPGHAVALGASPCAQSVMLEYLSDGVFPRRDLYCQGEPMRDSAPGGFVEDAVYQFGHAGFATPSADSSLSVRAARPEHAGRRRPGRVPATDDGSRLPPGGAACGRGRGGGRRHRSPGGDRFPLSAKFPGAGRLGAVAGTVLPGCDPCVIAT